MAFETINVLQAENAVYGAEDGTVTFTLTNAITAGSALVLIGAAVQDPGSYYTSKLNSVSDDQANTWSTPTNAMTGDYLPNAFVAYAINCAAGSTTVTGTFSVASYNRVSWALYEISGIATSDALEAVVTGVQTAGNTSTSTSATGTLSQASTIAILCAGGYLGTPSNPSGWVSELTQANGTYIGCQVSSKILSSTDSVTGTVPHSSSSGSSAAVMLVLRAAVAGAHVVRPVSDVSDGTWTASDAGPDLYAMIDEEIASDADYIEASTSGTCEVALGVMTAPPSGYKTTVKYRISGEVTVSLRQGTSTEIASWTENEASATTITRDLSSVQQASISDWTDLRLRFVKP